MADKEIWKDIPAYEGLYQVSNFGNIKALAKRYQCGIEGTPTREKSEHILRAAKSRDGYLCVVLCKNGTRKTSSIHRLVALSFCDNPQNEKEVNHKDGDKQNNYYLNLEWVSRSKNIIHAFENNLKVSLSGGKHGCARIVLDMQTGVYYDCAKSAALAKGINYSTLINKLSGWHKLNKTGLTYV